MIHCYRVQIDEGDTHEVKATTYGLAARVVARKQGSFGMINSITQIGFGPNLRIYEVIGNSGKITTLRVQKED